MRSFTIFGAVIVSALVAGCTAGSGAGPTAEPSSPDGSPPAGGLYLRAWQTQALAPQYTFAWPPLATIANGTYVDGQVAVPAIYPGPLWVGPSAQTITQKGIDAIVAEARRQGLLGDRTDFTDSPALGSTLGHLDLAVDGKVYSLTGDPSLLTRCRCIPDPGTPAAFAAFWQRLTDLAGWLPDELGPSEPYEPSRIAVLTVPPSEPAAGITANEVPWPLATPFAGFGKPMGSEAMRCGVVSGADLAALLPVVRTSSQLTRFVDSRGARMSLQVRALVPDEPSPCV
jgi:hypothetical protein